VLSTLVGSTREEEGPVPDPAEVPLFPKLPLPTHIYRLELAVTILPQVYRVEIVQAGASKVARAKVTVPLLLGATEAGLNEAVCCSLPPWIDDVPKAGDAKVKEASKVLPVSAVSGVVGWVPEYNLNDPPERSSVTDVRALMADTIARFKGLLLKVVGRMNPPFEFYLFVTKFGLPFGSKRWH
jgi:hypothetical protein